MKPVTYYYTYKKTKSEIEKAVRCFAENGAENLVLTDGLVHQFLFDKGLIRYFRKLLDDTAMRFVDSHALYGVVNDLCSINKSLRPHMLSQHIKAMEIASTFGVETITIHMGKFTDFSVPVSKYVDATHASLEYLLPYAEKYGITICIENVWYPTSETSVLLDTINRFNSPNLGICLDAGHYNIMSGKFKDPANRMWGTHPNSEPEWSPDMIERLHPHITICHIHDNNGIADQHYIPGDGNIEWDVIIPKLLSAPRLKSIQCESAPYSGYSIPKVVSAMNKILHNA